LYSIKNCLSSKIHRWNWHYGYSFVLLEQEIFLIKYNIEKFVKENLVDGFVSWFPNFWVRKLIVVEGNRLITIFFLGLNSKIFDSLYKLSLTWRLGCMYKLNSNK
jgi:hypothetical protein